MWADHADFLANWATFTQDLTGSLPREVVYRLNLISRSSCQHPAEPWRQLLQLLTRPGWTFRGLGPLHATVGVLSHLLGLPNGVPAAH